MEGNAPTVIGSTRVGINQPDDDSAFTRNVKAAFKRR